MDLSDVTGKIPATPGIDPGIIRVVAQCLNHYATPGHMYVCMYAYMYVCVYVYMYVCMYVCVCVCVCM